MIQKLEKLEKLEILPAASFLRLYLDTCVLVDVFLDRDEKYIYRRKCSELIFNKWKGELKISPFVIGEFIAMGRSDKYKKNFEEMIKIVDKDIFTKCTQIYTIFHRNEMLEQIREWTEPWKLAFKKIESEGVNIKNDTKVGICTFETWWNVGLGKIKGFSGHNIDKSDIPYIKPNGKIISGFFKAPAFEILLFNKASELSIKYNIKIPDALHILYAHPNEIDIIVSNDSNLRKAVNKVNKKLHQKLDIQSSELIIKNYFH